MSFIGLSPPLGLPEYPAVRKAIGAQENATEQKGIREVLANSGLAIHAIRCGNESISF
jgi:hypothetical protein